MARTIQQVFDSMVAEGITLATDANLPVMVTMFNSTSRVAVWKIAFYVGAFAIVMLEKIYDLFRAEIDSVIATKKPHTTNWYANKAKDFEYGYNLVPDADYYDNTGLTDDQIANSKIVKHAAVNNQDIAANRYGIRIKIAKEVGNDLAALDAGEVDAFEAYIARIKDAGTQVLITTGPADSLKIIVTIYYNPLVLNNAGGRLDGTDPEPVQTAIKTYLKNLPFNGVLVLAYLVDIMQGVDGVIIPHIHQAQANYGAVAYADINVQYRPDAGYLRIVDPADLTINWVPSAI